MLPESIVVIGGSIKSRKQKALQIAKTIDYGFDEKNNPDVLITTKEKDKNSIGIDQIRKILQFISTRPYKSRAKIIILEDAHLCTTQAQNALLKTLEEPPKHALIILCTKNENSILPTVLSRCKKFKIGEEYEQLESKYSIEKLRNMDIGEKLEIAQEISKMEKEEIIPILEDILFQERKMLLKNYSAKSAEFITRALNIKKDIESTNVNTRLAIENILLYL